MLIVQNNQGASDRYLNCASIEEANRILEGWSDPENLRATLLDDNGREIAVKTYGYARFGDSVEEQE